MSPIATTTECRLCAKAHCCLFIQIAEDLRQVVCPYTGSTAERESVNPDEGIEWGPAGPWILSGLN